LSLYTSTVIVSFKHKGLKRLFEQNDRSGLRADLTDKIERILTVLDAASAPQALASSKAIGRDTGPSRCAPIGGLFSVSKMTALATSTWLTTIKKGEYSCP
jgi:hypothetical protein